MLPARTGVPSSQLRRRRQYRSSSSSSSPPPYLEAVVTEAQGWVLIVEVGIIAAAYLIGLVRR